MVVPVRWKDRAGEVYSQGCILQDVWGCDDALSGPPEHLGGAARLTLSYDDMAAVANWICLQGLLLGNLFGDD